METINYPSNPLPAPTERDADASAREARRAALIEKLADAIVARRLEAPAALFLELNRPLGFLFSQAAFFARPFLAFFLPVGDIEAAAEVLDDPKALDRLIERIGEASGSRASGTEGQEQAPAEQDR